MRSLIGRWRLPALGCSRATRSGFDRLLRVAASGGSWRSSGWLSSRRSGSGRALRQPCGIPGARARVPRACRTWSRLEPHGARWLLLYLLRAGFRRPTSARSSPAARSAACKLAPRVSPGKTWEGVRRRHAGCRRGRLRRRRRCSTCRSGRWLAAVRLVALFRSSATSPKACSSAHVGLEGQRRAAARPRRRARSHRQPDGGRAAFAARPHRAGIRAVRRRRRDTRQHRQHRREHARRAAAPPGPLRVSLRLQRRSQSRQAARAVPAAPAPARPSCRTRRPPRQLARGIAGGGLRDGGAGRERCARARSPRAPTSTS